MIKINALEQAEGIYRAKAMIKRINRRKSGKEQYQFWTNIFGKTDMMAAGILKTDIGTARALLVLCRLASYRVDIYPQEEREKYSMEFPDDNLVLENWGFALDDPVIAVETQIIIGQEYRRLYHILCDTCIFPESYDTGKVEICKQIKKPDTDNLRNIRLRWKII